MAASVEQATENFLEKGDKIAKESQFLKEELVAAVEDVRKQGKSIILFYVEREIFLEKLILKVNFVWLIFSFLCLPVA